MTDYAMMSLFGRHAAPRHAEWFRQFCQYERWTGGPDPHMAAVVELARHQPRDEAIWRALLYVSVYNVPSAEAIWRERPGRTALDGTLGDWLARHWAGVRLRRERRTVNHPNKLARCLEIGYGRLLNELERVRAADFEAVWAYALSLPHVGRYAATKHVEIWRRLGLVSAELGDIRAAGGWSPRSALRLITGAVSADPRDDSPAAVREADHVAAALHAALRADGLSLSWFEFEVLLCEYKESYLTRRQYPGRSLDSELGYEAAVAPYWGVATEHLAVRRRLSPDWALGECAGWPGVRDVLGTVLREYGYVWSDRLYSYRETVDFAEPVVRQ